MHSALASGASADLEIGTGNGGGANIQQLGSGGFQSRICSAQGSTALLCTNGVFVSGANVFWHHLEIITGTAGVMVKLDDVIIASDPAVTNFKTLALTVWGAPSAGSAFFDDFEATLTPPGPLYSVCPLYDATKPVKSGATLPLKIQLCNGTGQNLSAPSIGVHATGVTQLSTQVTGEVQDAGNANPDNDFRFDGALGSTGGYIFNLSTKGLTTGIHNLNFTVTGDSAVYAAQFQVK